jgi:hypothetical protein
MGICLADRKSFQEAQNGKNINSDRDETQLICFILPNSNIIYTLNPETTELKKLHCKLDFTSDKKFSLHGSMVQLKNTIYYTGGQKTSVPSRYLKQSISFSLTRALSTQKQATLTLFTLKAEKDSNEVDKDREVSMETKELGDMRKGRMKHKLIYLNWRLLYCIGGVVFDNDEEDSVCASSCEIYSIIDDQWKYAPELNEGKHSVAACVFDQKVLYVFGGAIINYKSYVKHSIERLDVFSSSLWCKIILPNYFNVSFGFAAAAIQVSQSSVLIFGGRPAVNPMNVCLNDAYLFNTDEMNITQIPDLRISDVFQYNQPLLLQNKVRCFVQSGFPNKCSIQQFNIMENIWEIINLDQQSKNL